MSVEGELHRAFRERADGVASSAGPLLGLFGDGMPLPLLRTTGAFCADVKAPPLADAEDGPNIQVINEIAESFIDDFTCRFLHRFAAGAFDRFEAIIFARDDVAGLTAYQYACELRRQKLVPDRGPALHLWNLVHTDTEAAQRYNLTELDRLCAFLIQLGLEPDENGLAAELDIELQCRKSLNRIACSGADRFVYRMAGRWLMPADHLSALDRVIDQPEKENAAAVVGIVGSASDDPALREICGSFGTFGPDLMPFGAVQSYDPETITDAESLVRSIATSPLHIRANPASRFGAALRDGLAGCDIVVCAVDRNDDSFGWEIPGLRRHFESIGTCFIDLGFMPFRPDEDWAKAARTQISEALQ